MSMEPVLLPGFEDIATDFIVEEVYVATVVKPKIIKSISFDQVEILKNIIHLHTGPIECDVTYGSGCFYKKIDRPSLCFDIAPRKEGVIQADCCNLPLLDCSVGSVMFDPPFMARTGPGATLKARFGEVMGTIQDLWNFYFLAMKEIHRVLTPKGWLVFKLQNGVLSGKNNNTYRQVCNQAEALGLRWVDEFVLLAKHRMMHPKHTVQKHARKFHSYFCVFQKPKGVLH